MTGSFIPTITPGGWAVLPALDSTAPGDAPLESSFVYPRAFVRDWAHPADAGKRLVQIAGHETDDLMQPDAVTFAATAEQLRDMAWDLVEAGDRADHARRINRLRFAVRIATGACYVIAAAAAVCL